MRAVDAILDEVYAGRQRATRDEIYRHAVAVGAPAEAVEAINALPEGEYALDEVAEALDAGGVAPTTRGGVSQGGEAAAGVAAGDLPDEDLMRELGGVHRTRGDALRFGSEQSLAHHDRRTEELETEYLRRFPEREVDPQRLRSGARQRDSEA